MMHEQVAGLVATALAPPTPEYQILFGHIMLEIVPHPSIIVDSIIRIANAESDQEGLHEHVSDRLYIQADSEDDVQPVYWIAGAVTGGAP